MGRAIAISAIVLVPACGAPGPGDKIGEIEQGLNWNDPNWVLASSTGFSGESVPGGVDDNGAPVEYFCRASFYGSIQPGKTEVGWNVCTIGYGGASYSVSTYQTLVPTWTSASGGSIPANSIAVGRDSDGTPFYLCRGSINPGDLFTGKLRTGYDGCYVPYELWEIHVANYDVLVKSGAPDYITTQFVSNSGPPPETSITVGHDNFGAGAPLHPCLAWYNNALIPGYNSYSETYHTFSCVISSAGQTYVMSNYYVLVANLAYPPIPSGDQEYVTGVDTDNVALGTCAANYLYNSVQLGKYFSSGACNFGYGSQEISVTSNYRVLVGQN
jgi:hypothetical protein